MSSSRWGRTWCPSCARASARAGSCQAPGSRLQRYLGFTVGVDTGEKQWEGVAQRLKERDVGRLRLAGPPFLCACSCTTYIASAWRTAGASSCRRTAPLCRAARVAAQRIDLPPCLAFPMQFLCNLDALSLPSHLVEVSVACEASRWALIGSSGVLRAGSTRSSGRMRLRWRCRAARSVFKRCRYKHSRVAEAQGCAPRWRCGRSSCGALLPTTPRAG